ncbi:DUF1579 family protein [Saccharothrix syringae]|uniref:DUF1579 domain-containing protein n=1 Tax=Saccharothrix syringae TaxID=103733 RepID=A0A5Q0H6Z7_SACSY|nr:DUF1579 family protein [Saccharothrix syringae]QFZ21675.1 DUF1579 domain-containing protein [Saccharothrix syringae]
MDGQTSTAAPAGVDLEAMLARGLPDNFHRRLDALVGEWTVDKRTYIALGTPDNPKVWVGESRWRWLDETGGRFLREDLTGDMGGGPYYRLGVMGYSTMDGRYEWNTLDNVVSTMMTYKGAPQSAGDEVISLGGEFTDPGVLGESYVGKRIAMRTVFTFESPDRVVVEIRFVPPGEPERVADRAVYHRRK